MARRIAIVDMGSNSIKFSVTEVGPEGEQHGIDAVAVTVRLGAGVASTGQIEPARVGRALDALKRYETRARRLGAVAFHGVATAALRMARNGGDVLERIAAETSWQVRVITGDEEARLTFLGLTSELPANGTCLVADIGGASTELLGVRNGTLEMAESVSVGSGTLADRCFTSDPPGLEAVEAARGVAEGLLGASAVPIGIKGAPLILPGGNGTFLSALTAWDQVKLPFVPAFFPMFATRLADIPAASVAAWLGIAEERARMLPAGAAIVWALILLVDPPELHAVQSGIRGGLVRAWIDAGCPADPVPGEVSVPAAPDGG